MGEALSSAKSTKKDDFNHNHTPAYQEQNKTPSSPNLPPLPPAPSKNNNTTDSAHHREVVVTVLD